MRVRGVEGVLVVEGVLAVSWLSAIAYCVRR